MAEFVYGRVSLRGGEDAYLIVVYDAGNLRISDALVRNGATNPLRIEVVISSGSTELLREFTVASGDTLYPITGNRQLIPTVDPDTGADTFDLPVTFSWSANEIIE